MIKNLPANAGIVRDMGSIPEWGRSPGEGHGNPLQYSRLENPMHRRAWWAIVHVIGECQMKIRSSNVHRGHLGKLIKQIAHEFIEWHYTDCKP